MTSTLRGKMVGGGYDKNEMLSDLVGGGLASVLEVHLFMKGDWICAIRRYHTKTNVDVILTWNLPFGSDVTQWSYPLVILLHCLWAVTWLGFVFLFCICSFACVVQLLFHRLFMFSRCPDKTGWLQNKY